MKPISNWNHYGALGNRVIWGNMDRLSLNYSDPSSEFGIFGRLFITPTKHYGIQSFYFCCIFSEMKWKIYTQENLEKYKNARE